VALAFDILAVTDLANGRLVRLFDVNLPPMIMYSVVTPETWSGRPKIAAFRNWLLQEAGAGKQDNGHAVAAA
jgi:LysR family transcriptional regulator, glycine cleavage system transcriptional activator